MLTYPSDSLPHLACPMDEDAIPPNPFCSAPPHSDPPPPLLSLSSTTPSLSDDGIPGHRRSSRIQRVQTQTPKKHSDADSPGAQRPSRHTPSPAKRQRQRGEMVQLSQSKQPRVDGVHTLKNQNKDGFDVDFSAQHQYTQDDQKTPPEQISVSAKQNVENFSISTNSALVASRSNMEACAQFAVGPHVESGPLPAGWLIGPLFQSFKSKMASFTEIVMSPVKLLKGSSPLPSTDDDDEGSTFYPETQSGNENRDDEAHRQRLSEIRHAYSKKINFDVEMAKNSSRQENNSAIDQKEEPSPDLVPLPCEPSSCVVSDTPGFVVPSTSPSDPSVNQSASLTSSITQDQNDKHSTWVEPLLRDLVKNVPEMRKTHVTKCLTGYRKDSSNSEISELNLSQSLIANTELSDAEEISPLLVSFTQPDPACLPAQAVHAEGLPLLQQSLYNNHRHGTNRATLKTAPQPLTSGSDRETLSTGKTKRTLKLDGRSLNSVKKKRLQADSVTQDTRNLESMNKPSKSTATGLRSPRKRVVLTDTITDCQETLKPVRNKQAGSTRKNRKDKGVKVTLTTVTEAVLDMQTEGAPDAHSSVFSGSCCTAELGDSSKRLKTRALATKLDGSFTSMALETTVAISSPKEAEAEQQLEVLIRPDTKQLNHKNQHRNVTNRPPKRKSPNQVISQSESSSVEPSTSPALSLILHRLSPTDVTSQSAAEQNRPPKRSKRGSRVANNSSVSETHEATQCTSTLLFITKEGQSEEGERSPDPLDFQKTPLERNLHAVSFFEPSPDLFVQLIEKDQHVTNDKVTPSLAADSDDFSNSGGVRLPSLSKSVTVKPRRAEAERRRSRILHNRIRGEDGFKSATMEDTDLPRASSCWAKGFTGRLLRSSSCPEIPSLHSHDASWSTPLHTPHHNRSHALHPHHHSHSNKHQRRARRHTVCSVEVEREIAPLCLRKEVYPSRRMATCDQHSPTLSPSSSFLALASCFLSSPLAFLSKKADGRGVAAATSSHVPSSSVTSLLSSSGWHHTHPTFVPRADSSGAPASSSSSGTSPETGRRSEEDDDGEDTSSSSQEFEDVGLREEKALSDSEIKVVQKLEEPGKVSSIRIRKTLPKPQNNLTPMGLPKPIRLKKKQFSLEEIYTNKNFSKPPESRLETIFEVPMNRKNGSESWFGQRRLKRFLKFLDGGEPRKPKKPLPGSGKAGGSSSSFTSRPRRGGFAKEEPSLSVPDLDSLLCSKLDQLNLWLIHDQVDS